MVSEIQYIDEYYHLDDDSDDDELFYAPLYYTTDEQLVIVACLLLLEQRYRVLKSMTPQQIVDEIEEIISALDIELKNVALSKIDDSVKGYFNTLMEKYNIPLNYVEIDTSMYPIVEESINTLTNQLEGELKVKAMFSDDNLSKGSFNILPNFRRAVQKLVDAVGVNLIYSKEKTSRNVDKFVYGKDKLYYWLTANDEKVCSWCKFQESLPPRTLDEMPLDHPHGHCEREPVDYLYSDEYMLLLARGENYDTIGAFRE